MAPSQAEREQMTRDLHALGVEPGGVLLVHSSLRSLGLIDDPQRAETAVLSLLDALGPQGTLLMPALSYETVGPQNPIFDVRNTPTCVGALPEYFRTRAGTKRSLHPTHSVSGVGRRVDELLGSHQQDTTPAGENSPFAKLPKVGGQVLFMGCGLRPNTSMHAIEEHVLPPYLYAARNPVDYKMIREDDSTFTMTVRSHGFKGWEQRYDRLEGIMAYGLRKGRVLQADCYLLNAAEMWLAALTNYRNDPLFFVERSQQ